MTPIERPYSIVPFSDLAKRKCPWISDLKTFVDGLINAIDLQMNAEAAADGQPELTDEDFLYERFNINRKFDRTIGNWQIFKYFIRNFRKKIFYEMLGDWRFSKEDLEMYEYFRTMDLDETNKCQPRYLNFKTIEKPRLEPTHKTFEHLKDITHRFYFWYSANRMCCPYRWIYINRFWNLELVIDRVMNKENVIEAKPFVDIFALEMPCRGYTYDTEKYISFD